MKNIVYIGIFISLTIVSSIILAYFLLSNYGNKNSSINEIKTNNQKVEPIINNSVNSQQNTPTSDKEDTKEIEQEDKAEYDD